MKNLEKRIKRAAETIWDMGKAWQTWEPYDEKCAKYNIRRLCLKKNERAINVLHEAYLFLKKIPIEQLENYEKGGLKLPSKKVMMLLKEDVGKMGELILAYKLKDNKDIDENRLHIEYGMAAGGYFLKDYAAILKYQKSLNNQGNAKIAN
ncbi:MAG: hypothetical protein WC475_03820 [Candidatus Paceibacterota bacterium]